MPANRKKKLTPATPARARGAAPRTRRLDLRDGRALVVLSRGREELVEIRSASGDVALRIQLTAEGPVLRMESVRLELKAAESVDIEAPRVRVTAAQSVALASQGEVEIAGEADVRVGAGGEVHVRGKMIYLN